MDLNWIWKAVLIVMAGTLLLRIAGRKSISQMTLAQTVIMIGIGSLLVQPIAGKDIWTTLAVGTILVLTLVVMEWAQIKSDKIEKFITGKSKILIESGTLNEKNLRKLRLTVDQLEMNLRQQNITSIKNIEWATLEPNGQIGYVLKQAAQPVTKKEFEELRLDVQRILQALDREFSLTAQNKHQTDLNLFTEIEIKSQKHNPPKYLQ